MTLVNDRNDVRTIAPTLGARRRHRGIIAIIAALVIVLVAHWVYSYDPLASDWQHMTQGQWGTYVGSPSGVEAHYTTAAQGGPLGTEIWNEPKGTFLVQLETEITNTGSHAVRIDDVGRANVSYPITGYHVSFYRDRSFPFENGTSFRPFVLAGHAQRMVVVTYLQRCTTRSPVSLNGQAQISGPTALAVTYSFLGFTHTTAVPVAPFILGAPQRC